MLPCGTASCSSPAGIYDPDPAVQQAQKLKEGDNLWWYRSASGFVNFASWSATTPDEDIANSWEAYFCYSKKGLGKRLKVLDDFFRDQTY